MAWTAIRRAGEYEFTLSATPAGSKIVAVIRLADAATSAIGAPAQEMATRNWYSVASAANGSQLVLTGGPSESAPVLSITRDGNNMVLSWPAFFGGFLLQQTVDISAPKWEDVTNSVNVIAAENQIRLPLSSGNYYFRLNKK